MARFLLLLLLLPALSDSLRLHLRQLTLPNGQTLKLSMSEGMYYIKATSCNLKSSWCPPSPPHTPVSPYWSAKNSFSEGPWLWASMCSIPTPELGPAHNPLSCVQRPRFLLRSATGSQNGATLWHFGYTTASATLVKKWKISLTGFSSNLIHGI